MAIYHKIHPMAWIDRLPDTIVPCINGKVYITINTTRSAVETIFFVIETNVMDAHLL